MRILFLGNTNNEPYRLAHELSLRGHKCTVVLTTRSRLDSPRQLRFFPYYRDSTVRVVHRLQLLPVLQWMKPEPWLSRQLRELAASADVVITNGYCHSFGEELHQKRAAFITGSDLVALTSPSISQNMPGRMTHTEAKLRRLSLEEVGQSFAISQSAGIQSSGMLITVPRGVSASTDETLDRLGLSDDKTRAQFVCALSRTDLGLPPIPSPRTASKREPVFLCASRVDFTGLRHSASSDYDSKGTDVLLHGWAIAKGMGLEGSLHLVRKGLDVSAAESLIDALGVRDSITWVRNKNLRALNQAIVESQAVIDSLGQSTPGRITLEGLINSRPVIGKASTQDLLLRFGGPLPGFLTAATPLDVANHLRNAGASSWEVLVTRREQDRLLQTISPARPVAEIEERLEALCANG